MQPKKLVTFTYNFFLILGCAIDYVTDTLKDIPENEDYKNNWVSLAKYLGLDESTISDLEWRLQYLRNDREMCDPLYKLLDTWVDIFREKAELNRLIESLEYCKWNSLSGKYAQV